MSVLTLTLPRPTVDEAAFRQAMSRLASGVAIVACWDGSTPRGLLVSSLTTLSTEPPRVLFCVNKSASAHDALLAARECSLALLSQDDRREAERFSRSDLAHERFRATGWRLDPDRPPQRRGGVVRLNGFVDQSLDAGSHSIVVLRVGEAEVGNSPPMVYFDRAFHRLLPFAEDGPAAPSHPRSET
jgi:flavin reductase